jgi:hypothetical protein
VAHTTPVSAGRTSQVARATLKCREGALLTAAVVTAAALAAVAVVTAAALAAVAVATVAAVVAAVVAVAADTGKRVEASRRRRQEAHGLAPRPRINQVRCLLYSTSS